MIFGSKSAKWLAVVLAGFAYALPALAELEGQLTCPFVGPIQGVFLNQHINYNSSDKQTKQSNERAELEKRAIDQYVKRLDPSKLYFLAADVASVRAELVGILADVEKRPQPNCQKLDRAQKLLVQRVQERVESAKKLLGKGFQFRKDVELVLDPDVRTHFKSTKEADEFQEKYVQFQISNFLATDLDLNTAKERILRRYERQFKQLKEKASADIYADYLDSFAHALDPHSSYFSADVMDDFRISMALSLEGIGATLSSEDGYTVIEQLIPGGAAAEDGRLHPKDKIVAVGQGDGGGEKSSNYTSGMEDVYDLELRDVVRKIRGKKGTSVRLSVLREGMDKTFVINLKRNRVKLEDEAASISYLNREVSGKKLKVGLINLPSFYADSKPGGRTATDDLAKLLVEANKQKVDSVVLDFSSNAGGSLDDAVKIAGLFFRTGAVVKQSAKIKGQETILSDSDKDVAYAGPLVVLTSRVSASASEIVAGTLRDYSRAVVVGADHTFGKGSIQSVIPLPSGLGAAKVTVGMFYTPGGNSTQHRGVDADIVLPSALSTDEVGEKTLDYSLPPSSLASFISPTAYVESGMEKWQQVTNSEISQLKNMSKMRVEQSDEFKKIVDELEKSKKKDKHVVSVQETFKERNESNEKEKKRKKDANGNSDRAERLADYLKRADVQEAVNVAADLAAVRKGVALVAGRQKSAQVKEN